MVSSLSVGVPLIFLICLLKDVFQVHAAFHLGPERRLSNNDVQSKQVQQQQHPHVGASCTASSLSSSSSFFQQHRRAFLGSMSSLVTSGLVLPREPAYAVQDTLNVEEFIRTGVDLGGTMGVSSQAGKSRPQTGVVFRDGSQVLQDRQGSVSAEILTGTREDPKAVLISFTSPWKLETGPVFDVECRDGKTGDGAFLAVTERAEGKSLADLPESFFLKRLFDPTGRFSFYGPPTDVKVKKSRLQDDRRIIELSFSNLSQSTNSEIPRKAVLVATIPPGTDNAIMLVGSATANRWNKGVSDVVTNTVDSFRAIPAPKTSMKLRSKDRSATGAIF